MISELHQVHLPLKYGLDPTDERVQNLISSVTKDEAQQLLHRDDVGSGILIRYPGNGAFTIRLDDPHQAGDKQVRYLRRKGEPNALFDPGVDLDQAQEIWVVEGEMKSLGGFTKGLSVLGLSGVWCWRTENEDVDLLAEGDQLHDDEALLPELQRNWTGKRIALIYDSDIVPGHKAYDAYPRLAEQLYSLGAAEIRIVTLPSVLSEGKTGLDDFLLEKGAEGPELIQKIVERTKPYIPYRDGAEVYVKRLLSIENPDDLLLGTAVLLVAKGEFLTRKKLETLAMAKKDIDVLMRDAKKKAQEIQARPVPIPERLETVSLPEEVLGARKRIIDPHYTVDDFGQICVLKPRDVCGEIIFEESPICNFTGWPTREVIKDDGATTERFIEMKGMKLDYNFPTISIPMSTFGSMKWVAERWGARANIHPRMEETLRYVLQSMVEDDRPDDVVFTHLGWRKIGDTWAYLHASGAVGADNAEVEINPRLTGYSLPEDDVDVDAALRASLKLLTVGKEEITYPLLTLVYLAPLLDPLTRAGREPGFATFMAGTTGSFKSTITALFLSHLGHFDAKGLPCSFRDTALSVEMMAFLAKDTILAVDDLYPPQNPREKARLESTLEYLTRSQGDRQGRGRLQSDIKLRTGNPPRGLALCTGEEMNLGPGSSYYRLLILPVEKGDIDPTLLTEAQDEVDVLPYAMKRYLEFLVPQMEEAPDHLRDDFDNFRAMATNLSTMEDKHRRLDEVVAHLAVGFMSLARFAIDQGVWTEKEAKVEMEKAITIFVKITDSQAAATSDSDPVNRFFNGLQELLATGKIYLATMDDERPEDVLPAADKAGWGPDVEGMIYLSLSTALEKVKALCRGTDEPLMVTSKVLLDLMEARGVIQKGTEEKPRRIIVKKIAKKSQRVLPVPQNIIFGEAEDE